MPQQTRSAPQSRGCNVLPNLRLASAIGAALLLLACSSGTGVTRPPNPAGVEAFQTSPFGDVAASLHQRALFAVLDQLERRFGRVDQGKLKLEPLAVSAAADPGAIDATYGAALTKQGFAPFAVTTLPPARAVAWVKGDRVFALVSGRADGGSGPFPLTIVTNLE
jgi:hypothetical protein